MAEYLCEADMSTGEYISRDEALKIFHQFCDNCTSSYNGVMCRACADAGAMDILIDMPAADVQPIRRGQWIIDNDYYTCSRCNHQYLKDKILSMTIYPSGGIPYYCPCCGADMRGEQK